MRRRARGRERSSVMNLDSLMDILSCLVGVMLFLVIYTVLELGSTVYQAVIPVVRDPARDAARVVVLAENGTVRVLDVAGQMDELLGGIEVVELLSEVPLFVESRLRDPVDDFFSYSLNYEERLSTDFVGTLDVRIEERDGVVGDSIHQLDTRSRYAGAILSLDPTQSWLSFMVDTTSVEVFRVARELATTMGFAVRWDPGTLELPLTVPLSSVGGDWLAPIVALEKPLR